MSIRKAVAGLRKVIADEKDDMAKEYALEVIKGFLQVEKINPPQPQHAALATKLYEEGVFTLHADGSYECPAGLVPIIAGARIDDEGKLILPH